MPLIGAQHKMEGSPRKRTLDVYLDEPTDKQQPSLVSHNAPTITIQEPTSSPTRDASSPLLKSSPPALTDAETCSPSKGSPSPIASPSKSPNEPLAPQATAMAVSTTSTSGAPPAKRKKKLTPEEKEAAKQAEAARKAEREAEKKRKQIEKERQEAEKDAKKAQRQAEKAKADEEKRARMDEKARQKEQEDEERKRKEASQPKLNAFFSSIKRSNASVPAASDNSPKASPQKPAALPQEQARTKVELPPTPQKPTAEAESTYCRLFKPFFVKERVRLATNRYQGSAEQRAKRSKLLDDALQDMSQASYSLASTGKDLFPQMLRRRERGRDHLSVKKIMTELRVQQDSSGIIDLTSDARMAASISAREQLRGIKVKHLFFREDVRPPYAGTATSQPPAKIRRLATRPCSRGVLPLDYDYDSEAEWVDDGDGEDIGDDGDEDDDDIDAEDMDDFLDDSEDSGPARRTFVGDMEPESTGLCFEDNERTVVRSELADMRMEFMLPSAGTHGGIDPFSTEYWPSDPKPMNISKVVSAVNRLPVVATNVPSSITPWTISSTNAADATSNGAAGPLAPRDANSINSAAGAAQQQQQDGTQQCQTGQPQQPDPKKLVPQEHMARLMEVIQQFHRFSRAGLVDIIAVQLPGCTKTQIRYTMDVVAENVGGPRKTEWKLRAGFSLAAN